MVDPERPVQHGRIRRTMPLAGFTARAAGGRVVAGLRQRAGDADAVERHHERTAERYADLLGHSKGVLMKAGQLFSMVDTGAVGLDALSPYQRALVRLQADAPPMDRRLARQVLEAELGRRVDEVFAKFETSRWRRHPSGRSTARPCPTVVRWRSRFSIPVWQKRFGMTSRTPNC